MMQGIFWYEGLSYNLAWTPAAANKYAYKKVSWIIFNAIFFKGAI